MKTIRSCDILVPNNCDHNKWSVVACDQFTSERGYWKKLEEYVGDEKSTLKLIFPEAYLEDEDKDERIENINRTMKQYLDGGVFKTLKDSFIVCKRTTASGISRLGIVLAVDLEDYCFTHPSDAYIRSTEGVVLDRIPPRLKIRQDALVELPHIMLLIDDRKHSVIEPIWSERASLEKVYDFDLNMGGGHLEGYRIDAQKVIDVFENYVGSVQNLYGGDKNDFIFAVGDGNHSLAAAKAHWENVRASGCTAARYALCEIVDISEPSIEFEPIYRIVKNCNVPDFLSALETISGDGEQKVTALYGGCEKEFSFASPTHALTVGTLQNFIDSYIEAHPGAECDYIHGTDSLRVLSAEKDCVGFIFDGMSKDELFPYVTEHGVLPRKTFSMGDAHSKRYYTEVRGIV